jgi:hypothetical protein
MITVTNADLLHEKATMPIPTGGLIRGYVIYLFTDVSMNDLLANRKSMEIRFQDTRGNQFGADASGLNQEGKLGHVPGTPYPDRKLKGGAL